MPFYNVFPLGDGFMSDFDRRDFFRKTLGATSCAIGLGSHSVPDELRNLYEHLSAEMLSLKHTTFDSFNGLKMSTTLIQSQVKSINRDLLLLKIALLIVMLLSGVNLAWQIVDLVL